MVQSIWWFTRYWIRLLTMLWNPKYSSGLSCQRGCACNKVNVTNHKSKMIALMSFKNFNCKWFLRSWSTLHSSINQSISKSINQSINQSINPLKDVLYLSGGKAKLDCPREDGRGLDNLSGLNQTQVDKRHFYHILVGYLNWNQI